MGEVVEVETPLCFGCGRAVRASAVVCPHCKRRPFLDRQTPVKDVSTRAVIALVLSVTWLFWIGSVLGIILGTRAGKDIAAHDDELWGKPLATGAVAFGWAGIGALVLGALYLSLRLAFTWIV